MTEVDDTAPHPSRPGRGGSRAPGQSARIVGRDPRDPGGSDDPRGTAPRSMARVRAKLRAAADAITATPPQVAPSTTPSSPVGGPSPSAAPAPAPAPDRGSAPAPVAPSAPAAPQVTSTTPAASAARSAPPAVAVPLSPPAPPAPAPAAATNGATDAHVVTSAPVSPVAPVARTADLPTVGLPPAETIASLVEPEQVAAPLPLTEVPDAPSLPLDAATMTRSIPVVFRRRPRTRVRRVTRVVRHVDTWSVFKVALVFNLVLYVVALTAGVLLWNVAYTTGTIDNVENFFEQFGWSSFQFRGGEIYHNAWIAGLFGVIGVTGLAVLLATLFNLITDLVGGVRVSVLEEEAVARPQGAETTLVRKTSKRDRAERALAPLERLEREVATGSVRSRFVRSPATPTAGPTAAAGDGASDAATGVPTT